MDEGVATIGPSKTRRIIFRMMEDLPHPLGEDDPRDGGLSVFEWVTMWRATHRAMGMGGFERIEWPDGRSYVEQPAMTVAMMNLIQEEVGKSCSTTS